MPRIASQIRPVALFALACTLACGDLRVPPDESLTPSEYEEAGFPPFDADWRAEERAQARAVLAELAADHPERLPRFASESSGVVFARLLREEFERRDEIFEGALSGVRVRDLRKMDAEEQSRLARADQLETIYGSVLTGGRVFDRELVQFSAARLRQLGAHVGEVDGFIARRKALIAELGASDESGDRFTEFGLTESERIAAIESLERSEESVRLTIRAAALARAQVLSTLASFAVNEAFTPAARSDATGVLSEQLPQLMPQLSDEARGYLREPFEKAAASPEADPRLRALLLRW